MEVTDAEFNSLNGTENVRSLHQNKPLRLQSTRPDEVSREVIA
jgi:hypothetical protein